MTIATLIRRSMPGMLAAGLLWLFSTAASATTVLFENFDPEAPFAPTFGLNIWSACTGRAMPFTVTEAGYVAYVQFPVNNWGVPDRGNLVVEILLDHDAATAGFISAPDPAAVVQSVTQVVSNWADMNTYTFNVDFGGATLLQPGTVYWLAISLDQLVPVGVPGLTWWSNTVGQEGPTAARAGMPPDTFWYLSRYDDTNAVRIVGAVATPIPGTLWLLGSALGAVVVRIARRRNAAVHPLDLVAVG
ncbi:MAG: hypothetical protein R3F27_07140 [Gammaproteobacteria bacterium]